MARTYYVKRAQQRYETKPVLNEDGTQKMSPKMRHGKQMTSKSGRPVFMKVTERDLTRPKPMPQCSKCGVVIEVGQPYKYTETYNRTIIRCEACPTPQPWEYSSSLSARVAQLEHEANQACDAATDLESLEAARDDFAAEVRSLAEEKEEAAQNMEDGFGHSTYQSDEIRDVAEQLSSWADDIESVDFPELPEPEEVDCEECGGTGEVDDESDPKAEDYEDGLPAQVSCPECDGTGQVTAEEPSEEQMEEWLEQAREALQEQIGACPV